MMVQALGSHRRFPSWEGPAVIGLRRRHSVGQSVDLGKDYRGLGEGR